jgi:hypothetical protein
MMSAFVAAALAMMGLSGKARAGVVININQVGSDVVATGSGTINLTDLTYSTTQDNLPYTNPFDAQLSMGPVTIAPIDIYSSITGPTTFGTTDANEYPTTGTGSLFAVYGNTGALEVPQGYTSGTPLSATDTYSVATFISLGLTPGTYTWNWGTGANADFFTVNIGTASVPEPCSLVLSGIAVAGVMAYMGRRRKAGRA